MFPRELYIRNEGKRAFEFAGPMRMTAISWGLNTLSEKRDANNMAEHESLRKKYGYSVAQQIMMEIDFDTGEAYGSN